MGAPYAKRYVGGFNDLGLAGGTPADSVFLNAVEDALLRLLGAAPAVDTVGVWTPGGTNGALVYQKLTNAHIDAAAGIAKSKLAALNIGDGDVAAGAGIAKSKLATLNIVDADVSAISINKLTGYPADATKFPRGDNTWASIVTTIAVGTSLPGSPVDGDEYILVDSTTAPTYAWHFRYSTAVSDANKWLFVGGADATVTVNASQATASTSLVDLATVGPSFTIPRAGVYTFRYGARTANSGLSQEIIGLIGASEFDRIQGGDDGGSGLHQWSEVSVSGIAASQVVKLQYAAVANTATFVNRRLVVRPVRVA